MIVPQTFLNSPNLRYVIAELREPPSLATNSHHKPIIHISRREGNIRYFWLSSHLFLADYFQTIHSNDLDCLLNFLSFISKRFLQGCPPDGVYSIRLFFYLALGDLSQDSLHLPIHLSVRK